MTEAQFGFHQSNLIKGDSILLSYNVQGDSYMPIRVTFEETQRTKEGLVIISQDGQSFAISRIRQISR